MASTVPRFPEQHIYERVLGPDTYDPRDPCAPLLSIHERSRRTANFLSDVAQRPAIFSERTEPTVAPGAYDPSYAFTMPDVARLHQFATKKSHVFASTVGRFATPAAAAASPDTRWTLDVDAKEWNVNRRGGGCWPKAERHSGSLAAFLKQKEEAAALTAAVGAEARGPVAATAPRVAPVMVPLDYCFKELRVCEELVGEEPLASYTGVAPRKVGGAGGKAEGRGAKEKARAADEEAAPFRYMVNTVRLNNNLLTTIVGLPASLGKVCTDLSALAILDLSFNRIASIDASISQLPNLSMLRLHANCIHNFEDICHLLSLPLLHRLTLMNNPLDQHRDYRQLACSFLPHLKCFDNVLITSSEQLKLRSYASSPRGRAAIESIQRAHDEAQHNQA
ncbi:hypothetical protein AB1Y20_008769 [Prymnesium parvum]|uniref:Leucine-rich repeat-containing protein 51 n=1 Tax=Prymnesium parvum TaxID=97485 RepID=A0AB34IRH2_PRYPA